MDEQNLSNSEDKNKIHLKIEISGLDEQLLKELISNLALDWQESLQKRNNLTITLEKWKDRSSSLVEHSDPVKYTLVEIVQNKISQINHEIENLDVYISELEKEIQELQQQQGKEGISLQGRPHEIKRELLKNALEQMLGEKISDISLQEKFEKKENQERADEELARLKEEIDRKNS